MNTNQLKHDKAQLKSLAETIVNASITSKRDMEGSSLAQYNSLLASIKRIDADLEEHAAGATFAAPGQLSASGMRGPIIPGESASTGETARATTGLRSNLRNVIATATPEQREEINNLAAYLTGRTITATADLRPSGAGGLLVPSFIVPTLERDYAAFAPVVSVARLWATDGGEPTTFPVLSDSETAVQLDSAAATGADATVSGDTPPTALTGPRMNAWKISSKPVFIPRELFTDSPVDIVSEVVGALLARIIRFENLKYTLGNGTTEAEGFLTNSTKLVTGAVALDLDIALSLAYNVPAQYRTADCVFQCTDSTAKYLRSIKTGIAGDKRLLWADADYSKGTPALLHGYPLLVNPAMDSVAPDGTFAAGKYPLAFGNFSKFVVRQAEQNQPYAYQYPVPAKDGRAVILFRRSDSKLIIPAAITKVSVS